MNKSPIEDGANVTPNSLRVFAESLKQMAALHESLASSMEVSKVDAVYAKNLKSAVQGLVNVSKFVGAATTSYCDHLGAHGVAELEGAMAMYRRYLKRTGEQLHGVAKARREAQEAIAEEVRPKRAKNRK